MLMAEWEQCPQSWRKQWTTNSTKCSS